MASQAGYFTLQQFTDAGVLLAGGRIYTYAAGTTTFKTAYTDLAGVVPQTYTADGLGGSYIALNARAEIPAPLYLATGSYDITLKRADGSTVWTRQADPNADSSGAVSTALTVALANATLAAQGAGMVGYNKAVAYAAGTVGVKLLGLDTFAAEYGYTPGNATAYSAAALNATVATLAAQGKKLIFPAGVFLWDDTIILGNGASIEGAGSGYSSNAKAYTKFVCQSNTATAVIRFYDAAIPNYIEVYCVGIWATYSTNFDHTTFAGNLRRGFFLDNQLTNSTLDQLYVSECRYGYYAPKSLWSCNVGTLSATLCYMGWFSGTLDYATSLNIRALQIWRCFQGAYFGKITYCSLSGYIDSCGLNVATPTRLQIATEVPIGLAFSEAKGVFIPAWGSEFSSTLQIVASSFSSVKVAGLRLDQNSTSLWRYDAARALPSFIAMATTKQALFLTSDSVMEVSGMSTSLSGITPTANDLFAATTGSLTPALNGILFTNCFVDAPAYAIDYPKSSVNPAAVYYSDNIKCINVLKQFNCMAASNIALSVNIDENGVGSTKLTPTVFRDYARRYVIQKATGQEGWEAGTTMALNLNVRSGLNYFGGSLKLTFQPSEAAGAARSTAGVQVVVVEVLGNSNVVTANTLKSSTSGSITATLDGPHPTFILINSLVLRINYDIYVEETLNRFCLSDFPVGLVSQ